MKKLLMLMALVGLGLTTLGCAENKPAAPPAPSAPETKTEPAAPGTDVVAPAATEEKK